MKKEIGYAIVGDGVEGFKFFGELFCEKGMEFYWENRGYRAVPISVEMTDELKEFSFY
jgi:hypothetical protein